MAILGYGGSVTIEAPGQSLLTSTGVGVSCENITTQSTGMTYKICPYETTYKIGMDGWVESTRWHGVDRDVAIETIRDRSDHIWTKLETRWWSEDSQQTCSTSNLWNTSFSCRSANDAISLHIRRDADGWYADTNLGAERSPERPATLSERLKAILDDRQAPGFLRQRANPYGRLRPLRATSDIRERRARETLRRVIGDRRYEGFRRTGYITARAISGKAYQIFPGSGITCVYEHGKLVERLCVVLCGDFPPCDSLIMRYLMVLNNEQQFRGYAISHFVDPAANERHLPLPDLRPLPELYRELKAQSAPAAAQPATMSA